MSLDNLSAIINTKRDNAETVRTLFKKQADSVRSDNTRTGMGKKSLIAGALRVAQQKLKQLQEEEAAAITNARFNLEREVFGTTVTDPSGILAYRDAQARADELTINDHDKAQTMLHNAALSADHTLASAILSRSLTLGWTDLIDNYKQRNEKQGTKLDDLLKLDRWNKEDEESLNGRFGAYFIGTPDELRGTHEAEINRLAKADGSPAVVTGAGQIWGVA